MQAQAKAEAEGKSAVRGVFRCKTTKRWSLRTLQKWGPKQRRLATANTREEAEVLAETYFPRLKAAAADGKFDDEFAAVRAEIKAQV